MEMPHPFEQLDAAHGTTMRRPRVRVVRLLILQAGGYSALAERMTASGPSTSAGYLHDLAHGRRDGSEAYLARLATVLGVSIDDITTRTSATVRVAS